MTGHQLEGETPAEMTDQAKGESFGLNWSGKGAAIRLAQIPTTKTLVPQLEESIRFNTAENIFIEGDNLEALRLLQTEHQSTFRLIYIDPPYNTGKEFIYSDNFREGLREYCKSSAPKTGSAQAPEKDGRLHSRWLSMMYPRLVLARELLRDDGVIFISIDDNEFANLRLIMNEIFGEANFIATLCHKARGSVSNDKIISSNHHYILLFAREYSQVFRARQRFGLNPDLTGFDKEDSQGKYKLVPVDGPGGARKGNPFYAFLGVSGHYRFSRERMEKMHAQGLIVKNGETLLQKYYLAKAQSSRKTDTTWWDHRLYTATATNRLKSLLGGAFFTNPKPVELIQRMCELWLGRDDQILDFFAGSGTTGHAVLDLNRQDGGNRRFVLVQLPEPVAANENASQAGFHTIADICRARLRGAIKRLAPDWPGPLDTLGFKSFRISE